MAEFKTESLAMRFLKMMGLEGIAWSLRRLHVPVGRDALVLDVGSGGNPYPRANVLLDGYEETIERYYAALVIDRPLVLGMVERLPFKNKSFDFVIASHILEHSLNPGAFLNELMRVANGGYIETPDAFFERINPFRFHRTEVTDVNARIRIFRKPSWRHNEEIVNMYERKVKDKKFIKFLSKHPEPFYMRFYWSDHIDFEIVNPEVDSNWPIPVQDYSTSSDGDTTKASFRKFLVKVIRILCSQNRRNKKIDLFNLLICPSCNSESLSPLPDSIRCNTCGASYPIRHGIPVMYPQTQAAKE